MLREYETTFLGITADDIKNFVTLRHRFDNPFHYRCSIEEITHRLIDYKTNLKVEQEKYVHIIQDKQIIEKDIEDIKQLELFNQIFDLSEQHILFPYRSFLSLRYWRKAPKSLKIFFQALACLFSITNNDFLTELKRQHHHFQTLQFYRPSSIIMDEFRIKYLNSIEISSDYIRNKSSDAYIIAIWMHKIEENERLTRLKQPQIEKQKQLENKLIQLNINLSNKQKELHLIDEKIKRLRMTIDQIENHRQILLQSN